MPPRWEPTLARIRPSNGLLHPVGAIAGTAATCFIPFRLACAAPSTSRSGRKPVNEISVRSAAFIDHAIFHDDGEVLLWVGDQVDVGERIAFDQQQVCERAGLDHSELPRVGRSWST